jgi:hypothetical protein
MSHLIHTVELGIATIILDRSPQNRIGDQMVEELATAINAIERSDARPQGKCLHCPALGEQPIKAVCIARLTAEH